MKRAIAVLVAWSLLLAAPSSWALAKGESMFALQFTDGSADLADAAGATSISYLSAYSLPEVGAQAEYWRLLSDDYAWTIAAGMGISRRTSQPGNGAPSGSPDLTGKSSSFDVRLGGDRVVKVGERAMMYGGPGVEFWSGKAKYEGAPGADYEGPRTKRFGLSARLGGIMMIGEKLGLAAHVGHRFGYATASQGGAKTHWWPSGFDGSMGFIWTIGGSK